MKYYFINNPTAGSGKKADLFNEKIAALKDKYGSDIEVINTSKIGDATTIASDLARSTTDNIGIFACGGDGTMNEVLNGIVGFSNVTFGIVPTGSCNDFLKTYPDYDFFDLDALITGKTLKLDVLEVNGKYCLNVANIGFDAKVNHEQFLLRATSKSVKEAYVKSIIKVLFKKFTDYMTIKVDDKVVHDGKTVLIAHGNGVCYGGGYYCCPNAIPDDGLVDIFLVKKMPILRFVSIVNKFKAGKLFDVASKYKFLYATRGKKVEISSPTPLHICLDGEDVYSSHVSLKVLNKVLNFRLPVNE